MNDSVKDPDSIIANFGDWENVENLMRGGERGASGVRVCTDGKTPEEVNELRSAFAENGVPVVEGQTANSFYHSGSSGKGYLVMYDDTGKQAVEGAINRDSIVINSGDRTQDTKDKIKNLFKRSDVAEAQDTLSNAQKAGDGIVINSGEHGLLDRVFNKSGAMER